MKIYVQYVNISCDLLHGIMIALRMKYAHNVEYNFDITILNHEISDLASMLDGEINGNLMGRNFGVKIGEISHRTPKFTY
jgi:hypothetical protein